MPTPPTLYHYTCQHSARNIQQCGELRPNRHPLLRVSLVWLTEIPWPDRYALGLTSSWLSCDRTEVRVQITPTQAITHWPTWAARHHIPAALLDALGDGAHPDRWWVSPLPLRINAVRELSPMRRKHP